MLRDVLITISPSMIEVAALSVSGSITAVDTVPLDPSEWDRTWEKGLVSLDSSLQESFERLGVGTRARATLVYHDPDALAEVFSLPGSTSDAFRAASLGLAEAFPGGIQGCPSAFVHLATDRASDSPRHHILGVVDRNERLECLCDWVRRAGATVKDLIPAKALLLAHAVDTATAISSDGPAAALLFAEHATVIVGVKDRAIRVTRLIAFGHDLLTDAVLRAARSLAGDDATLTRERATYELFRAGLPGRDERFPLTDGLTGAQILPLTQPVQQRLAVEIKQTLRFALEENDLSRVKMVLTGTGAAIPGLAGILSDALDAQVDIADDLQSNEAGPFRPASEVDLFLRRHLGVNLLPSSEQRHREYRRAVAGVRVGAVAAIAALTGAYLVSLRSQQTTAQHASSIAPVLAQARDHASQTLRAASVEDAFHRQIALVDQALAPRGDWHALLAELSTQSLHELRLTEIQATITGPTPTVVLKGLAFVAADARAASPDALGVYIDRLSRSPLVAAVDMGPTRASEADGRSVKLFTLTLKLHPLPDRGDSLTDAPTEGQLGGQS